MREQLETQNINEILGVPQEGIIFTDFDGVWFPDKPGFSGLTPEELQVIRKAKEAGFWLVLNSDSASRTLTNYVQALDFNPLIIAENGAVICLPQEGIKIYLSPFKQFFDQFKLEVITDLNSQNPDSIIIIGDATSLIQRQVTIPKNPNRIVYLVNFARECSLGVFTRVVAANGELVINEDQTEKTLQFLQEQLERKSESGLLVCRKYDDWGSCLVKDPQQKKWQAVRWIINQFPPSLRYYMIGDTLNDSMEPLEKKVVSCAVGNATSDYQEFVRSKVGIIAPPETPYSQGAIYIIKQIISQSKKI